MFWEKQEMRKIIAALAFAAMYAATAGAATRCIPFSDGLICTVNWSGADITDSESTCTTGTNTFTVHMIGICAADEGANATVAETIHTSSNPSENTHCWCRMLKPTVSKWVSVGESCTTISCSSFCRLNGMGYTAFRRALFQNSI